MSARFSPRYDAVVIGGGPCGAVAARMLALENLKVAIIERDKQFPMRVGESLMPHVFDTLRELGLEERMRNVSYVDKFGASFGFGHDESLKRIAFTDGFPAGGTKAYNVERSSFDEMLLEAAREAGAQTHRGCAVQSIEKLADGDVEIVVSGEKVKASYLVDASGASTVVGRHLGLRQPIPDFRKLAYYSHFTGVERGEGRAAGDVVVIMCDEGWFWLIPIDETRTSVGLVVDSAWAKQSGVPPLELLEWAMARVPQIKSRCEKAVRIGPIRAAADFSYVCKPCAGPGYFMSGDSAIFVDPIFSAGVCLGMMTGKLAAEGIVSILRRGASPDVVRQNYISYFENSSSIYFRLTQAFYRQSFREFIVHPRSTFQINRAMIAILGGHVFPPPLPFYLRWRLRLFEFLIKLQRLLPIVPHRRTFSLTRGGPIRFAEGIHSSGGES
jgi:flavin-dependent dehydrogenase